MAGRLFVFFLCVATRNGITMRVAVAQQTDEQEYF